MKPRPSATLTFTTLLAMSATPALASLQPTCSDAAQAGTCASGDVRKRGRAQAGTCASGDVRKRGRSPLRRPGQGSYRVPRVPSPSAAGLARTHKKARAVLPSRGHQ
jgi:hypothetical protein